MNRVLVVEDDEAMAVALRDGFVYEGYEVSVARDGEAGLQMARENPPDLMILDVMLPKMTGLEICKVLRGEGSDLPIIMLTARGQEIDKVLGLKLGADDYVTKPFSFHGADGAGRSGAAAGPAGRWRPAADPHHSATSPWISIATRRPGAARPSN